MKHRAPLVLAGIAILVAAPFAGFGGQVNTPSRPAAAEDKRPHVEVARPVRKTVYRKFDTTGNVIPNQQVVLYARVGGYLESIGVDRGSPVKTGEVLANIAVPDLEAELARQQADLAVAGPSLARDEANVVWQEAVWRRIAEAAKDSPNLISPESLDEARGRYETARAERDLTVAKELGMRATVEETKTRIGFATLAARFDGVVTERWTDPGDLVHPATTRIVQVTQVDPVRVRIAVPQSEVPFVRADSRVKIAIDELRGRVFEANVSRLLWALQSGTKTMGVEVDLRNTDGALRPGMFAHVSIELEAHPNALVLPATALVTEKRKSFVFVVRDGVANRVPLKIGADDGIEVEVLEGVGGGDDVIVNGKNLVSDGDRVLASNRR